MSTRDLLRRRKLPGLPASKKEEHIEKPVRYSCVLILAQHHAVDLVDLLEKARTSSVEPHRFDHTPLGEVLQALKSGGRIG